MSCDNKYHQNHVFECNSIVKYVIRIDIQYIIIFEHRLTTEIFSVSLPKVSFQIKMSVNSSEKPEKTSKCKQIIAALAAALFFIVSLIFISWVVIIFQNDDPNICKIVESNDGFIRGKRFETFYRKRPYFAFKGIKYGKAPIGNLRFKVCCEYMLRLVNILFQLPSEIRCISWV